MKVEVVGLLLFIIVTSRSTFGQLKDENIHFAVMDSMFLKETFDTEVSKALEKSTNLAADPAMNFDVSFVSAVLTITDEYSLNVVGTLAPVLYETLKEEYENKDALGKIIEKFKIRDDVRTDLYKKHITISNIIVGIKRLHKYPARLCVQLESANGEMLEIVSQLSSRNLNYHLFPSVTSQLILTMAPIAFLAAKTMPYLEEQLFRRSMRHYQL
ncbi:uncharacterized protein LOC116343331 isoform X2 [Contarinia nasturtii]|uniref:uncharacterized protein LOC116343331 isoform X2 n=1 Tax=Contarinia nasturtii TaxID=265458 RepID=UPI0012D3BCDD|nr:uncharacterized protein LOC116343331 isoform X2 [Contarinia nasturtii]